MSSPSQSPSPSLIVRFLDSFLQERNIKWVLAVGMTILFGSSMVLVTTHWDDYTFLWQNLIVLGYSAAVHFAGQWTYHRLGLRRTGNVLQGLTVLLIPILFLVIHWLPARPGDDPPGTIVQLLLLAATTGFSVLAARRIFGFFLRSTQPTFLVCYLLLAIAGALLPLTPTEWAPVVVAGLWGAFAIGAVKVSRHVFWLTEERRAPRILGFFPIAILGAQFLFLYAAHPALHVTTQWIGFGCVLVAIPILATADSVVRVFQQRTGDLVRPLPWAIVLPVIVAVVLCAAGVILSGFSLVPPNRPRALVATAALTSGLMLALARRTAKEAFVWATLVCVMIAYNFSPAFVMEFVRSILDHGAVMVRESRLPFAFYGLTYLPFLLVLLLVARYAASVGRELYARPMRLFAFGLTCLLWTLSLTHDKAMFPVGLALAVVAALQVRVLRSWSALIPAMLAWMTAAYGLPTFLDRVLEVAPLFDEVGWLAMATGVMLVAGLLFDRWLVRLLPETLARIAPRPLELTSLAMTLALAGAWSIPGAVSDYIPVGVLLGALLVIHALRTNQVALGAAAILFLQAIVARTMIALHLTPGEALSTATWILLGQWLFGRMLEVVVRRPAVKTLAMVNCQISAIWLASLMVGTYLPLFAFDLLAAAGITADVAALDVAVACRILMALWTIDLARRLPSIPTTALAYVSVLSGVGAAAVGFLGHDAWLWLPTVWAATGLVLLAATEWLESRFRDHVSVRTANVLNDILFTTIALGSLVAFDWPMRLPGLAALAGFARILWRADDSQFYRLPLAMLLNLQALCLTATLVAPGSNLLTLVSNFDRFALPMAAVAAASVAVWHWSGSRHDAVRTFVWLLRGLWLLGLLALLAAQTHLTAIEIALAGTSFTMMAVAELFAACRQRNEARVWAAEAIVLVGVLFFLHFRVVTFHHGFGMFAILGIGVILKLLNDAIPSTSSLTILHRPLRLTSFGMPLITVAAGIARHVVVGQMTWLGANSLTLLLAAAFYFWRGLEDKRRGYHVLAAVILDIALILLWRDLAWTDPQFFMVPIGVTILALVELLKGEIPESFHNPLRYAGALTILVSPTFHIVSGSWIHLLTLMVASVAIAMLAIGLRVRALLYAGSAFLLADFAAMLVVGSIDNSNILWIAGFLLGAAVIALGAYCEKHREELLSRMHLLASNLKTWE